MAIGDSVTDIQSIANNAYLDIQANASEHWVITEVYHESNVALSFYDGTNEITFESVDGQGAYTMQCFHVNDTDRIRVLNDNTGASKNIGYAGVRIA